MSRPGLRTNLESLVLLFVIALSTALLLVSPRLALGLPLALLAAGMALRKVTWKQLFMAYLVVLFFIPTDAYTLPSGLPFDLQPDRILLLIIIALWITALLIDPKTRLVTGPSALPVVVFLVTAAFSQLVNYPAHDAVWFDSAVKRLIYLISFVLSFFFIGSVFGRRDIESILRWSVIFGATVAVFGVIERQTGENYFYQLGSFIPALKPVLVSPMLYRGGELRIVGSSEHALALSVTMAMLIPLAIHFWITARTRAERVLYYGAVTLMLLALILTVSRSGVVLIVAAVAVWLVVRPGYLRRYAPHLLIMLLALQLFQPRSVSTLREFFFPEGGFLSEGSVKARVVDYPLIDTRFWRAPFLGMGFDMFDPRTHFFVDNQYLKFAVEMGALGVLALLWLFGSVIFYLYKGVVDDEGPPAGLLAALLAAVAGFVVVSAFFDSFGFHQGRSLFFIMSALGLKFAADRQREGGEVRPQ